MDEAVDDRDLRDVLWARVSQVLGRDNQPTGNPQWKLVHPARQRETMLYLRCQMCAGRAKTGAGTLFLETADAGDVNGLSGPIRTAQPPVCLEHARMAAERCPHLMREGHVALLATRCPLFGVIGTPYRFGRTGPEALAGDDVPVPYGDPRLRWFLASQLVRELRQYQVVDLRDLTPIRRRAA
ncbi:hypothetical protein [Streptomyces cavernicola]|uniref:Uncharacterized protein n=1 Tax=Streptomyces cavernicola TaxID=3043613 RepID=A0ABT6SLG6_9ACTN|nr:hypothetical protein [Streptomyces sp. B-S-A6]MDI3408914.1 hypothetical protein [Streptomyces sp. B-S-A6]